VWQGDRVYTVYITDYTQNLSLHNYSYMDNRNGAWQGPFGKYTLQLQCWNQAGDQAQKICQAGRYYTFRNVRTKLYLPHTPNSSTFPTPIPNALTDFFLSHLPKFSFSDSVDFRNKDLKLEGALNPDQRYPDKILIQRYPP